MFRKFIAVLSAALWVQLLTAAPLDNGPATSSYVTKAAESPKPSLILFLGAAKADEEKLMAPRPVLARPYLWGEPIDWRRFHSHERKRSLVDKSPLYELYASFVL